MNILAIDTVFNKCGVAVIQNADTQDARIMYDEERTGKRMQTQQILPMIDSALQKTGLKVSNVQALVFNRGPGAFSGIRINTAVVQALSVAHDIPCVGISSLQVLAQSAYEIQQVKTTACYAQLDARMKQVYLGEFNLIDGIMEAMPNDAEVLLDYGKSTAKNLPIFCLETDDKDLLSLHKQQPYQQDINPSVQILAKLGVHHFHHQGGVSAEHALPIYLRNNAWKTLKEQGKK